MNHKRYIAVLLWIILLICLGINILYQSRVRNESGKKQRKIGAVYMTMNNPYFEVVNKEIKALVKNEGDLLFARDSMLDSDTQNQQIEELITQNIDILLVNAVNWKEITPGLKKAKAAGIKIVAVDTEVYEENLVDCIVVSDNYEAGVLCAKDLMQRRESAKILFLIQSENKSAQDRIQGFRDTLDEADWDYEVVDELECKGQLEVAQPLVEELLEKKTFDVVMALNDPSALGAMAALDAKGMLNDVDVYGVDGAPEAKNMILEGRMTATVAQYPMQVGMTTVDVLYNLLNGDAVEKQIIPVTKITLSNISEFSLTGWQ